MAISKTKKHELFQLYTDDLVVAKNVVVIKQNGIGVTTATDVRKQVLQAGGKYHVVKKRIFKLALEKTGYQDISIDDMEGSVVILYAQGDDEYAPLKAVNKYKKQFAKDEESHSSFDFLGAWFDKKWQDAQHVNELANIPTKEELLSKLAWLLNYPLQSFSGVLHAIGEKLGGGTEDEIKAEEIHKSEEIKEVVEDKTVKKEKENNKKPEEAKEKIDSGSSSEG